ncbi:MAG: efflux RND transporter periplasmic adaptor subunit [Verrucomicrobia bacterium]|nr:MAG: efflux RND transporter periplasmic adaptor subunit [Verrucomicrobiota bacterium]
MRVMSKIHLSLIRRFGWWSALGLLAAGCHHQPPPPEGAPELPVAEVRLAQVQPLARAASEVVLGVVRPKLQATLEAKVSGRIEQLPVEVGQHVRKGDLIAALGVQEMQAKLDQAQAVLQQARRDLERYRQLLQEEAVTQAEYDAVEARHRVAEAAVQEARTMLDYAQVRAPFDGVITRKHAEQGDLAAPGRPIVTIEATDVYRLETDVPETLVSLVKLGDKVAVEIPAIGQRLQGVVAEIAPAADPGSRTFRVKLDLPPTPGLLSGQFGRAFIPLPQADSLQVPAGAVVRRGQLELVFVVTNNVARMRVVKTGRRWGDRCEILAGLQEGETVVSEGADRLRDGQRVQPAAP